MFASKRSLALGGWEHEMRKRKTTEERRREIANATLALAIDHGVSKLTTAAIAREVGLAEGTIFRHFDSKIEIILAAIERLDELLLDSLPLGHSDPLERLGAFFASRVTMIGARPGVARILFSDELGLEAGERGLEAVRQVQQRSIGFVRSCLVEAHARDMLRPGLDPEELVIIVQGAALALVNFGRVIAAAIPPEQRARKIWEVLATMMGR